MKLVETRAMIAEDGSIILKPWVLETMDMKTGDTISLAYLAARPVESFNTYSKVLVTRDGIESITEPFEPADEQEFVIPHLMLEVAGIPLDGGLDIQCVPGMIVIRSDDPLESVPSSLIALFDQLNVDHEVVRTALREGGF